MPSPEQVSGATIEARIVSRLSAPARTVAVADVRIGLGYTQCCSRTAVPASRTPFARRREVAVRFHRIRPLSGRPAADLLVLLESHDAIEAGVGLACANSLVNRNERAHLAGDILEHLEVRPEDDVAMVGHFGPLVERLRKRARSLAIFERVAAPTGLLRPQEEALAALPRCQIALFTATSLINHTLDGLLDAARGCRQVVVLGASTPLMAEAFSTTGVTMLSGVVVVAAEEVLRVVSEGGGMRQFSPYVRKVTMKVSTLAFTFERSTT